MTMAQSDPMDDDEQHRVDGVYDDHLSRIMVVMREHYPKVLAANRFFEEETGIHNELGTNNLNDALSHLGTLVEQANVMTHAQQGHEVHDFEGHLRRGMMESYEQVFRLRMGQVEKLWSEHERIARPKQVEGELRGVPSLEQLDALRRKCKSKLDQGRDAKRGHDWDAWDQGTEALAEACSIATELATALEQGIGVAKDKDETQRQRGLDRRRFRVGLASGLAIALACLPLGFLVNEWLSEDSTKVPPVVGKLTPAAFITLADSDLRVRARPPEAGERLCRVTGQRPNAGRSVSKGTTVTLTARCR